MALDGLIDLSITAFDKDELKELLFIEPEADPDDVPLQPEVPTSTLGDVWICDQHRVMCGDSTKDKDFKKLMNGELADLLWVDPPYNVAHDTPNSKLAGRQTGKYGVLKYKDTKIKHDPMRNDDMSKEDFTKFLNQLFKTSCKYTKKGGAFYVCYANGFVTEVHNAFKDIDYVIHQTLVWVKSQANFNRCDYHWRHEPIVYGWKHGAGHYFINDFTLTTVEDDSIDFNSMTKAELVAMLQYPDVTYANKPLKNDLHATMKPIELIEQHIINASKIDELVIDCCGGSGST